MEPRAKLVGRLATSNHPDIVIIGGGCNGAGLFRDLALQGVPTLLVEKGDFSSGTSAAPTRLAHGGLKYLETGEVSLVRESAEERNLLLINAPHQVRPLPIWVPLRSWLGGAVSAPLRFLGLVKSLGSKGALAVNAGLIVYDRFGSAHRTLPRHSMFSKNKALGIVPQLSPRIRAVAQYYDALISQPERLVMELIGDAEADCPSAMAIPYMRAIGMDGETLKLSDEVSGNVYSIKPRLVINMAGAWADEVQTGLGFNRRMVGGTKGSHIVVRNKALSETLDGRMLYFEADDKRACIVLSLGEDRLFLGATDNRCDDPDDKRCSDEDIEYLFGVMKSILPNVVFSRSDIVYTVAGVRPLPMSDELDPGLISRGHTLHEFPETDDRPYPVFTLIGGKWTTYRACAEQIADAVLAHLKLPRKSGTKKTPIGGGRDFPRGASAQERWINDLAAKKNIPKDRAAILAQRYGSLAEEISIAEADQSDATMIAEFSPAELEWITINERVTHLEDIVQRRTLLAFEGKVTLAVLEKVAAIMAPLLGWSKSQTTEEIKTTSELLIHRHRMDLSNLGEDAE